MTRCLALFCFPGGTAPLVPSTRNGLREARPLRHRAASAVLVDLVGHQPQDGPEVVDDGVEIANVGLGQRAWGAQAAQHRLALCADGVEDRGGLLDEVHDQHGAQLGVVDGHLAAAKRHGDGAVDVGVGNVLEACVGVLEDGHGADEVGAGDAACGALDDVAAAAQHGARRLEDVIEAAVVDGAGDPGHQRSQVLAALAPGRGEELGGEREGCGGDGGVGGGDAVGHGDMGKGEDVEGGPVDVADAPRRLTRVPVTVRVQRPAGRRVESVYCLHVGELQSEGERAAGAGVAAVDTPLDAADALGLAVALDLGCPAAHARRHRAACQRAGAGGGGARACALPFGHVVSRNAGFAQSPRGLEAGAGRRSSACGHLQYCRKARGGGGQRNETGLVPAADVPSMD